MRLQDALDAALGGDLGDFAEAAVAHVRREVLRADEATQEALQQLVAEAKEEDASAGKAAP